MGGNWVLMNCMTSGNIWRKKITFILSWQIGLNQDCIENLFSIIRGKGGFHDNLDVEQFKAAFKYVVADKHFAQSDATNCKVDNHTILININNIEMKKCGKPPITDIEKLTTTDIVMVIVPPPSLPTQNIAAYLAWYLLRKIPINTCADCSNQLLSLQLPSPYQDLSLYEFLWNKTYKGEGCQIYPILEMANFVNRLETLFCAS